MMKRILSLVLAMALVMSLCACGTGQKEDSKKNTVTQTGDQAEETIQAKTYDVDLTEIQIEKLPEIVIASDARQVNAGTLKLENDNLRFVVDTTDGIGLVSIYDKRIGQEYLTQEENLFSCYVLTKLKVSGFNKSDVVQSRAGVTVDEISLSEDGTQLYIASSAKKLKLSFLTRIRLMDDCVGIAAQITSGYGDAVVVRMTAPCISSVSVSDGNPWACVPHELGWVAPYDKQSTFGAAISGNTGVSDMPTYTNSMELATVYSKDGTGGIYLMDSQGDISKGIPRIQMSIVNQRITGEWAYTAEAKEKVTMPEMIIGTYVDDDWHAAVDAYQEKHAVGLSTVADIPQWLREAGAIYSTRWGGAGGPFQLLDTVDISYMYINSYEQMDKLYSLAEKFGTNVIMLSDYQIAAKSSPLWDELSEGVDLTQVNHHFYIQPYENKGDYHTIREDWGGNQAFKTGVEKVHDKGGKVLVYVESFIVNMFSMLSKEVESYAAVKPDGTYDQTYQWFYSMIAADPQWQTTLTSICMSLVEDYDIDGIFLDSLGCQWNRMFAEHDEKDFYKLQVYNAGMNALCDIVRKNVRTLKSDFVIISECATGEMLRCVDGGWSADYAWNNTTSENDLLDSPLAYALPQALVFTNGDKMLQIKETFAAGFGLALCEYWENDAKYISTLMEIRTKYQDAFVYGKTLRTPEISLETIGVYHFAGETNEILTIVNSDSESAAAEIGLGAELAGSCWINELDGAEYTADGSGTIALNLSGEELAVLYRVA